MTDQEIALEIFSSDSYLTINKKLLKILAPNSTIFICNLVDKFKYFLAHGKMQDDLSFFMTHENQMEDTGMSLKQIRTCKNELKHLGVIKTYMKGIPPKEFYKINFEYLVDTYREKSGMNIGTKRERIRGPKGNELGDQKGTNIKEPKLKETKFNEPKLEVISGKSEINHPAYKDILSGWNKLADMTGLGKINKITSDRQEHLKARFNTFPTLQDWKELFDKIEATPFLYGENDRGWQCDFDWLIKNESNPNKILEGKYGGKKKKTPKRLGAAKSQEGKYKNLLRTVVDNRTGRM